jgi:hypothetical protein
MAAIRKRTRREEYKIRVIAVPRKTVDHKKFVRALMALAEKQIQKEDRKK